jgi:hypothetical protein
MFKDFRIQLSYIRRQTNPFMELFTLLHIRFLQLSRQIKGSGAGLLIVVAVFFGLIVFTYSAFQSEWKWYLLGGIILTSYSAHISSRDKHFILHNLHRPRLQIYLQFLVYTFPFTFLSLFAGQPEIYLISLLALAPLPYLDYLPAKKARLIGLSKVIRPDDFEWISGLRKWFPVLFILLLGAYAATPYPIVSLVILWAMGLLIVPFYDQCESLDVLRCRNEPSKRFLKNKVRRHLVYIWVLFIPVCAINSFFHPEHILIHVFFILMQSAMIMYAIFLKYAGYVPNSRAFEHNMTLSLVSVAGVLPHLFPLPFFAAWETYGRAVNNLKYYLND